MQGDMFCRSKLAKICVRNRMMALVPVISGKNLNERLRAVFRKGRDSIGQYARASSSHRQGFACTKPLRSTNSSYGCGVHALRSTSSVGA